MVFNHIYVALLPLHHGKITVMPLIFCLIASVNFCYIIQYFVQPRAENLTFKMLR